MEVSSTYRVSHPTLYILRIYPVILENTNKNIATCGFKCKKRRITNTLQGRP